MINTSYLAFKLYVGLSFTCNIFPPGRPTWAIQKHILWEEGFIRQFPFWLINVSPLANFLFKLGLGLTTMQHSCSIASVVVIFL